MTGAFSVDTPEKCRHYAGFMEHLHREEADAIFWIFFTFTIVLLIISATSYSKAPPTLFDPEKRPLDANRQRKTRIRCLLISLVCFILAIVAVTVEAFAAFSIQFCDGEDLMMLYWGFWNLLQVGALIAIFGIMLHQWYSLREKEHPPWNVALGTPVLVIAAVGHAFQSCIKTAWQKCTAARKKEKSAWSMDDLSTNRGLSISPPPGTRHVGYSLTNEPIYARPSKEEEAPPGTRHVGFSLANEPLFVLSSTDVVSASRSHD